MKTRMIQFATATALIGAVLGFAGSASAETPLQQCGVKFSAARAAKTLNGQEWNGPGGYREQCLADLKAQPAAATAPAAPVTPAPPVAAVPPVVNPLKPIAVAKPPVTIAPPVAAGAAIFPSAISPAHASEKPGKARENTCLDQYKINKANNTNGGLKWIEKGGGYYSQCNKLLKV